MSTYCVQEWCQVPSNSGEPERWDPGPLGVPHLEAVNEQQTNKNITTNSGKCSGRKIQVVKGVHSPGVEVQVGLT